MRVDRSQRCSWRDGRILFSKLCLSVILDREEIYFKWAGLPARYKLEISYPYLHGFNFRDADLLEFVCTRLLISER